MKTKRVNPFIKNAPLPYMNRNATVSISEDENYNVNRSNFRIDGVPKVTVYQDIELMKALFNCGPATLKLYMYVQHKVTNRKENIGDRIQLPPTKVSELMGVTKRTYYTAAHELADISVITPMSGKGSRNMYWLNPHYIWGGSQRADKIEEVYGSEYIYDKAEAKAERKNKRENAPDQVFSEED